MSEQDFAVIEGNKYRGSRYSNFAGAGIDAQGNVSSAPAENAQNVSNNRPYKDFDTASVPSEISGPETPPGGVSAGLIGGNSTAGMALNSALPYAASKIGASVGANYAAGLGAEQGFKEGISGITNKVSSGLLGSPAPSTVNIAAKASGVYGPPAPSAVSNVAKGANVGGAFGTGIGSFAATLLTGGSFKQAAASGIGSGIGYALGNMVLPGIGGLIGSTLGSFASSLFGSKTPRVGLAANIGVNDSGRLISGKVSNKGADNKTASKYASSITDVLNRFADAAQIKYKSGLSTETNIGTEDRKTAIYQNKQLKKLSDKPGDVGAVALSYLKNTKNYDMGGDAGFNQYLTESLAKARSISDLDSLIGKRRASQGLMAPMPPRTGNDRKASFYA